MKKNSSEVVEEVQKSLAEEESVELVDVEIAVPTINNIGRTGNNFSLFNIFNNCIRYNQIPNVWKFSIVTPLYKNKGSQSDMNNYRGISILPPISKLFEKLLAIQIEDYFSKNSIFFDGQHGFRSGFSCETALHEFISDQNSALNKKLISFALFIDFKKAFDLVDPDLLIFKLSCYGFNESSLELIRNYFHNRKQIVKFNDTLSEPLLLKKGVPQGSVLGPVFFLIFINDLPLFLNNSNVKLFADDTTIYIIDENLDKISEKFNIEMNYLLDWCSFNKMDINWSKAFYMIFTNKKIILPDKITLLNNTIEIFRTNSFKLLGCTIDEKLNFEEHVINICLNVKKKLYSIKRIFYLSCSVKLQFFKSFILPYFDYCLSLIIYMNKSIIQKLANMYYNCLFGLFGFKITNFNNDVFKFNQFLKKYNLTTFHHRLTIRLTTFGYSIDLREKAPQNLKSIIVKSRQVPESKYNFINERVNTDTKINDNHGTMTFEYYFGKIVKKFDVNLSSKTKLNYIKNFLNENCNDFLKVYLKMFPQLNVNIPTNFYFFQSSCKN
ncbi:unnamed protein product [Brachionus calyciflorus]|uniref:Reverse transcriptase domain-containing protein n=1 Tax=Brachionus calyciflorus TaxID=104777 RepID=A0A814CWB2_9BILA|nr:unnamed protein product [Brachionus calyciflorus]